MARSCDDGHMADANPPTANPTPRSPLDEPAPTGPQQVIEFGDYRAVLTGVPSATAAAH